MSEDPAVLGTGARGDPANPGWSEAEFDAHDDDVVVPDPPPDPGPDDGGGSHDG